MIRDVDGLVELRARPRRLLAVLPHPDDEAYGCAGALFRTGRDPGGAAVLLCLTRGEASKMGPERGLAPDEVGRLREARLVAVGGVLGLAGLVVPGLPDGGLARCDLRDLSGAIARVLEAFRPQVVVSHDPRGVNAHSDHIATHWAARHALLGHPVPRFAMLAYPPEVVEAVRPRLLFATPESEIDAVLDLAPDEAEAKERCLRIHEALVTLVDDGEPGLIRRPPVERYDFLNQAFAPPLDDLFARLGDRVRSSPPP